MMPSIDKGVSLIEASAGTGKTYTLCRIVLRLILEKNISIDRILAITFTQAATEELKGRIRSLLRDCLSQIDSNRLEEPILASLIENEAIDDRTARERLQQSLELFDEATISTIHGFCKRCLDLTSLDSGLSFDASLEPIESELVERLQQEYLRIHIIEKSPLLAALFEHSKGSKKRFDLVARECAAHPYATLEPKPEASALQDLERSFQATLNAIGELLARRTEIEPHLNRRSKLNKVLGSERSAQALGALVDRQRPLLSDLARLDSLGSDCWRKGIKKSGKDLVAPALPALVDTFNANCQRALDTLVAQYRGWLFDALKTEKERRNIVSFNDLIHILNRAINDDPDGGIARSIGERYDAALVDEFQDTDPIQYRIVHSLFGDGSKRLFLIGDPKQAIYRFRGADIFAYFEATRSPHLSRIHLSDNYRSTQALVSAANALFSSAPDGFAFDQIVYRPVSAARKEAQGVPLKIHSLFSEDDIAPSPVETPALLAALAAQDLAKRAIDDPTLDLGKVAFLVNRNAEADLMMQALGRHGIDSVIQSERSVFQSKAASILHLLLETLAQPTRAALTRALLLTPLCGFSWVDFKDPDFDSRVSPLIAALRDWTRNWFGTNFDSRFQTFLSLTNAPQRLLGNPDTERLYSDLLQLTELLQSEARMRRSSPYSLLAWLEGKAEENVSQTESWQTRLRSDEGKPQIVTVHKSKGLQFPIVIIPFISLLRPKPAREHALYHASDRDNQLVIDLSPEPDSPALQASDWEEYAEQLRLIYVAITRAVDECELYLAPEERNASRKAPPSSFCQMLLGSVSAREALEANKASSALKSRIQELDPLSTQLMERRFDSIEDEPDRIPIPLAETASGIRRRPSTRSLPVAERILSFSTLAKIAHSMDSSDEEIGNDEPVVDLAADPLESLPRKDSESDGPSIFSLPKGAHTGNLIHNILEQVDFQNEKALWDITNKAFARLRYGYAEYKPIVRDHLKCVLEKPLADTIVLNRIAPRNRVAELEFAYPTSPDVYRKLADAFSRNPSEGIPLEWTRDLANREARLGASMLRGFVDLVFEQEGRLYILDWKTNHLGNTASDYSQATMSQAMAEHDYYLQYCLYCVALKRHLEFRYPESSFYDRFGGVFYLFIRGIENTGNHGVFFDRPNAKLLEALDLAIAR